MEFNRGMVGVLVVVLALIASVILGVVTNIESHDVTKDVPEYEADITGGFTADREKSYTDYNSARNYNGYTNNTVTNQYAVDFNSVGYTNNYPISHKLDQATSPNITSPTDFTSTTTTIGTIRHIGYSYSSINSTGYLPSAPTTPLYTENHFIGGAMTRGSSAADSSYSKSLSSILSECMTDGASVLGTTPVTVQIQIPSTIRTQTESYMSNYGHVPSTYTVYYVTNNIMVVPTNYSPSTVLDQYNVERLRTLGVNSSFNTTILYSPNVDPSKDSCTITINDVPIYTGHPSNYKIIYGTPGVYASVSTDATGWGEENGFHDYSYGFMRTLTGVTAPNLTVTYFAETITDYIDTRYGVGVRNSEEVVWNNNQQNGITSIAFSVWDGTSGTFTDNGDYSDTGVIRYYGSSATDTFTVSRMSGRTYVALNGGASIDIGTWPQIQLNIDNINGTLTAYPITAWNNFNNYALGETSVLIGTLTKDSLSTITWTANNSFRFQVTNTTVFFNTYGVVMIDPHITIRDLWPNYSRFMLSFTKVATIGDSITLGGSTYPITDGTIEINGETLAIPDIELYYESVGADEWQVTLSTTKASTQITVPNTNISLSGTWYFNAGFYDIVTKHVKENVWNPIYDWYAGNLFFWMAGFVLIGGIISWKMGYADPMSILILIVSEVILIMIGGTT